MSKSVGFVVAVALMIGGLAACGGEPAVLSDAEVESGLATWAGQINAEGGLQFDGFSTLTKATAVSQTITIRGESILDIEDIDDSYHASRVDQAANVLCNDETLRELLRGRATVNFNWFSADNESIGDMITLRGDEACAIFE